MKYVSFLAFIITGSLYATDAAQHQKIEYDQTVFARTGRKIDINKVEVFVAKVNSFTQAIRNANDEWQHAPIVHQMRSALQSGDERQKEFLRNSYAIKELMAKNLIKQQALRQFYHAIDCDLGIPELISEIRPIQEAHAFLDCAGLSLQTLKEDEKAVMKTYYTGKPKDDLTFDRQKNSLCCACGQAEGKHKCSKCRVTRYCSVKCQRAHWAEHKKICR